MECGGFTSSAKADQLRSAAGADLDQLATKAAAALETDVTWLRRGLGSNIAISPATLAAVPGIAWTLLP